MALQRARIVTAALQLLDETGLEALTMRRLADVLGIQAPTLYYHLTDKGELLDWIAQAILSPVLPQLQAAMRAATWADGLAACAHLLRQALLAHREGARVVAGARLDRADALAAMRSEIISGLAAAGFPVAQARIATKTLLSYILGFVIEEQALQALADIQHQRVSKSPQMLSFPALHAAMEEANRAGHDQQMDFDEGVRLLLAGMRAWPLSDPK